MSNLTRLLAAYSLLILAPALLVVAASVAVEVLPNAFGIAAVVLAVVFWFISLTIVQRVARCWNCSRSLGELKSGWSGPALYPECPQCGIRLTAKQGSAPPVSATPISTGFRPFAKTLASVCLLATGLILVAPAVAVLSLFQLDPSFSMDSFEAGVIGVLTAWGVAAIFQAATWMWSLFRSR